MQFVERSILKGLILSLAVSAFSITATADTNEIDPEVDQQEIEMMMQTRMEQNAFFQEQLQALREGRITSIDASCKYVSSIFRAPPAKVVALTFDDGPTTSSTSIVLNTLREHGIKATFFIKGQNGKSNSKMIQRIVAEGHLVANHSWSHPNFHTLSTQKQVNEIMLTDSVLNANRANFRLFRYPYGNSTCFSNNFLKQNGYQGIVGWHVDSCDWAFASSGYVTPSQAKICAVDAGNRGNYIEHVVSTVKKRNGGIILMHDIHRRTAESLNGLIIRLKQSGFQFTNLDDPRMKPYL